MRSHHGQISLTAGCNTACSLDAHGRLNLMRHRRHLGPRRVRTTLAAPTAR
jgi:hypothetical protein